MITVVPSTKIVALALHATVSLKALELVKHLAPLQLQLVQLLLLHLFLLQLVQVLPHQPTVEEKNQLLMSVLSLLSLIIAL
jgi:hypothetical protein